MTASPLRLGLDSDLTARDHEAALAVCACAPGDWTLATDAQGQADVWLLARLDGSTGAAHRIVTTGQASRAVLLVVGAPPPPAAVLAALSAGARDVCSGSAVPELLQRVATRAARERAIDAVIDSRLVRDNLVGASPAWHAALRELVAATHASAQEAAAPILLLGATGTGKELLARLAHTLDPRPGKGELVVVDCTTLTPELAGSELFGHERGAFTGAASSRRGAVALADGGTLFLDEVGELPLAVQAQLLRSLQEGSYKPVGSSQWQSSRFRLIGATHRNLAAAVEAGRFRADLYWRLASCVVTVPSLAEREGDARLLAERFLREFGCPAGVDDTVALLLARHPFPGNVRELRQLMRHAARRQGDAGPLSVGALPAEWLRTFLDPPAAADLPAATCDPPPPVPSAAGPSAADALIGTWLDEGLTLADIEARAGRIAVALAQQREQRSGRLGAAARAARRLGISPRALQKRSEKLRGTAAAAAPHRAMHRD